jgi:hypothetical protein
VSSVLQSTPAPNPSSIPSAANPVSSVPQSTLAPNPSSIPSAANPVSSVPQSTLAPNPSFIPSAANPVSSVPQTTPTSDSHQSGAPPAVPSTTPSSGVPVVLPATNTPIETVTNTQISIPIPNPTDTGTPGSSGQPAVKVQNPDNPNETVTFGKTTLPQADRNGLPNISDAAPLALLLLFGGAPTFVTITSAFEVVFPLAAAPWLTLALFPAASSIGGSDGGNEPTASDSSMGSSTTTSAVSSTTSSAASCSALPYTLNVPDENEDDTGAVSDFKRSVAGRIKLEKRGKRFPFFGNCSPANKPAFPNNPTTQSLINAEKSPKAGTNQVMINTVARWYDRKIDCTDATPGFQKLATSAITSRQKDFNVDHAWELKFFSNFFDSFLPNKFNPSGTLECEDFNNVFTPCILNTLVNLVPSPQNPEFVAMRKNLNSFKGAMFKKGELANSFFTSSFATDTDLQIQALQDIGITVAVFNEPAVVSLFDTTNQRMYNAFQGLDQLVEHSSIALTFPNFKFADAYQVFMQDTLSQASSEAFAFVKTWMATVESGLAAMDPNNEETKRLQTNYNGFKNSGFSSQSHYSFSANLNLAGGGGTPIQFKRSLEARDGSCTLGQSSQVSSSPTSASSSPGQSSQVSSSPTSASSSPGQSSQASSSQTSTSTSVPTTSTSTTPTSTTPIVSAFSSVSISFIKENVP